MYSFSDIRIKNHISILFYIHTYEITSYIYISHTYVWKSIVYLNSFLIHMYEKYHTYIFSYICMTTHRISIFLTNEGWFLDDNPASKQASSRNGLSGDLRARSILFIQMYGKHLISIFVSYICLRKNTLYLEFVFILLSMKKHLISIISYVRMKKEYI